ncbi:MAG: hypothetical protein RLZZ308_100 [Candidatus Parcubacteria bacterium]|jgi:hypothetical protein
MIKDFFIIGSLIGSLCLGSCVVYAQSQVSGKITLKPENPEPKSEVTLTFSSYSFDAATAYISWNVNGTQVLRGEGETILTLQVGDVGERYIVVMKAETVTGLSIEQQITVTPTSVILLYEAPQSYTPVLYRGRSLPSTSAQVRVTALPFISEDGKVLPPSLLSYVWYVGNTSIKEASGKGKQTANLTLDYLSNKTDIKVVVRSPFGTTATKSITIYPHEIMPLLYTYNELFGTDFQKRIHKRFETTQDFSIIVEPFYVSKKSPINEKTMSFKWLLNGLDFTPLGGQLLTFTPKKGDFGSKTLHISVYGPDKRLQKGETSVELIFDTR